MGVLSVKNIDSKLEEIETFYQKSISTVETLQKAVISTPYIEDITDIPNTPALELIVDTFQERFDYLPAEPIRRLALLGRKIHSNGEQIIYRKYENKPQFLHELNTAFLMPYNSPSWAILIALCHDFVEDMPNVKEAGQKYLDTFQKEKEGSGSAYESFTMKTRYRTILQNTTNNIAEIIQDSSVSEADALFLLTRPIDLDYREYSARMERENNLIIRYWIQMIKLNDRWDNTHVNPAYDTNSLIQVGPKLVRDGIKNLYVLETSKRTYLDLGPEMENGHLRDLNYNVLAIDNYLTRMHGLASITNTNMTNLILALLKTHQDTRLITLTDTHSKFHTREGISLIEWYKILEQHMYNHYKDGKFNVRDSTSADPNDIFEIDGSLNLLNTFLNRKMNLFDPDYATDNASYQKNIQLLLKYSTMTKIISSLYLSYDPFNTDDQDQLFSGSLQPKSYGKYNPMLKDYQIHDFFKGIDIRK